MNNRKPPITLYITFVALLLLLASTIACSYLFHGWAGATVALAIAIAKALLIMLIFMKVGQTAGGVPLAAGAGFLWLCLAIVGVMADYTTRGWDAVPQPAPQSAFERPALDRVRPRTP